jgi:hypothetical protein
MRPVQAKEWAVVDYLLEPTLDPDRLGRAIRYAVERKRALALIEESEARKRAILETAIDSIVTSAFSELRLCRNRPRRAASAKRDPRNSVPRRTQSRRR